MSKIKRILVGIGCIVLIVVLFLFSRLGSGPNIIQIPKPRIPQLLKTAYELQLNVNQSTVNFPSELALLNVDPLSQISKNEAQSIAGNLGFTTEPLTASDAFDGTTYVWSDTEHTLFVYAQARKIEYSSNSVTSTINKQLSDEAIKQAAQDFLISKLNMNSNDFEFSFFTFIAFENPNDHHLEVTTKSNATVYQVNFSPQISESEIITLDPKSSPINVWVRPDGTIARSQVIELDGLRTSETKVKIKNFQEIESSINEAIVVSLDDGNIVLEDVKEGELERVIVNTIGIAYLFDSSKSTLLQPVYTLSGTAKFTNTREEVSAFLYLPAIAN